MHSNEDEFNAQHHEGGHENGHEEIIDDFSKFMVSNQKEASPRNAGGHNDYDIDQYRMDQPEQHANDYNHKGPHQDDYLYQEKPAHNDYDDYQRPNNYQKPAQNDFISRKPAYEPYEPQQREPPKPAYDSTPKGGDTRTKASTIQARLNSQKGAYEEQQRSALGTGVRRTIAGEPDPTTPNKSSLVTRLATVVNPVKEEIDYDHLAGLLKPEKGTLAGSLVQHDPSQAAVNRMHVVQGGNQKLPTLSREEHVIKQAPAQKDSDDESIQQRGQKDSMQSSIRQSQQVEEHKVNRNMKEEVMGVEDLQSQRDPNEMPIADAPAESARLRQAQNPRGGGGEVKMTDFNGMSEEEIKNFIISPVPIGTVVQGTITRRKGGFLNMYPYFVLNFTETGQFICSGRKRAGNKTSNYMIALKEGEVDKNSPYCIGKVRSNFLGTAFHVYDNGLNPDQSSKVPLESIRCEKALILYESNMLKSKTPRKMKVYLPAINSAKDEPIIWRPLSERDGMLGSVENNIYEGLSYYVNKEPKWNSKLGAFTLDFQGRVKKPSVKNFQLVDPNYDDEVGMQFGKVTDTTFNIDVRWPFSILQAFGVCLTSFDHKFACE